MFFKRIWLLVALLTFGPPAVAKLKVVTTVTTLRALAKEVGGDQISVESIAKGSQDPHFIEAKPSFMVRLADADLLIAIGLDLEASWLPSLQRGARNPALRAGQKGYLEVGPLVDPIEVPTGPVSRAQGDVHPLGNPHVWLDPERAGKIAILIANRLSEMDPAHAALYKKNASLLQTRLVKKTAEWRARIEKAGHKKIVTYHKTLSYFFNRFQIENPAVLEPKPGLPPTSGHILEVVQQMKSEKISLILVENYFDPTVTNKIRQEIEGVRTAVVAVAVEGEPALQSVDDLFEHLVLAIEGKK